MCTAMTFSNQDFYFGRTLDLERVYGEEVVITPRNCPLIFRRMPALTHHYSIIGMAHVADSYPLYYDAVNEVGLCMAGLNFPGFAQYQSPDDGKDNIASFEFPLWILGQCAKMAEARKLLQSLQLTGDSFSPQFPPTPLHWIIADRTDCITVEVMSDGIHIQDNPVGVLTNSPPFGQQMMYLCNFMHLSPDPPKNRFSPMVELTPYSRGMGAMGLPGDLSSQSRFVRTVFTKLNSQCTEDEAVSQFFHILGTINQTRGSNRLEDGSCVITQYTSCCNASRGIYHYTTYGNRRISAVDMHRENLEHNALYRFSLTCDEDILLQN